MIDGHIRNEIRRRLTPLLGEREARAVTMLLFEQIGGLSAVDVLTGRDEELPDETKEKLLSAARRVELGEPVQYVTGKVVFLGMELEVNPVVLIPRPETEELVRLIIRENSGLNHVNVLDIGTGSGCIALAVKKQMADARVEAWDVSADALVVANENNRLLGAQVTFMQEDALCPPVRQGLDVVVSNPPYICERERDAMEEHVLLHEPGLALFVPDDDPLRFYRVIAEFSERSLCPNGRLYFEINPVYAESLAILLQEKGFTDIHFKEDQFGKVRFVRARKSEK